MEERKDINRLKVVLAEKREPINGWLKLWAKIKLQFPSGAQTHRNPHLKC